MVTGLVGRGAAPHPDGFCNLTSLPWLSGCSCQQPWLAEGATTLCISRPETVAPAMQGLGLQRIFQCGWDGFSVGLVNPCSPVCP